MLQRRWIYGRIYETVPQKSTVYIVEFNLTNTIEYMKMYHREQSVYSYKLSVRLTIIICTYMCIRRRPFNIV